MITPQISIDTTSAGTPAGDPAGAAATLAPDSGERFAGQLAQAQSALPAGQNLAAGTLPLRTLALGPTLEVVTSPGGGPDGDSLAQFAKAQGLDDDVVAWLFSDATQAQVQAQSLVAIPIPAGVMALPGGAPGGAVTAPAALALGTPGMGAVPGLPGEAALAAAAAATTADWLESQQSAARLAGEATASDAIDLAQATATSLPAGLIAAARAASRATRADGTTDTFHLPAQVADMPVEILSLDVQEGLEALWDDTGEASSDTGPGTGSGQGAHPGSGTGAAAAASGAALPDDALPATTIGQRAAGYQELSQRLGEALAQRVMAQIERGNWEVRLLLKPARLGEVEIDLTLRSGALDAAFRATSPVTRDLLNEGLPRLREVLADAGMDIAGLNVASGRNAPSGGNPTPRQARGPDNAQTADTGKVTAAPAAQPRLRNTGSGWDVLV